MDIEKERDGFLLQLADDLSFYELQDLCYSNDANQFYSARLADRFVDKINYGWRSWQAAKAQAVPEKDAVIKKLSDQLYVQEMKASAARVLCETACELLDDYAHQDAMVILNDLEQAMIEAQEQNQ